MCVYYAWKWRTLVESICGHIREYLKFLEQKIGPWKDHLATLVKDIENEGIFNNFIVYEKENAQRQKLKWIRHFSFVFPRSSV